jgi:hypothetical protein
MLLDEGGSRRGPAQNPLAPWSRAARATAFSAFSPSVSRGSTGAT